MGVFPRMLAPTGSPVYTREVAQWLFSLVSRQDQRDELLSSVSTQLGVRHCFGYSTGRAAMASLLQAFRRLAQPSQREEVVVPGYTCYSVASSVAKAGLRLRVCDIDRQSLSYDLEQLRSVNFSRVLAIVTSNLYGLPNDLPEIERLAEGHGVFLLDDAAQSFSARVAGRLSGTFGSAGLFSLDKGKNLTAMQGGLVATDRDDLAEILSLQQSGMAAPGATEMLKEYIKLLVYYVFLQPRLYWIPGRMPFLRLGETRYEEQYPISQFSAGLAPIARAQLRRLNGITTRRIEVASWYRAAIPRHPLIREIEPVAGAEPVYLRFALRILDGERRHKFLRECADFGATGSYPHALAEVPEIADRLFVQNDCCANASAVSREIVTLPTHAYVTRRDVADIARVLFAILHA